MFISIFDHGRGTIKHIKPLGISFNFQLKNMLNLFIDNDIKLPVLSFQSMDYMYINQGNHQVRLIQVE